MQRELVAELVKCQQAASVTHVCVTLGVVDDTTGSWCLLSSIDPHRLTLHTHTHAAVYKHTRPYLFSGLSLTLLVWRQEENPASKN